LELLKEIAPSVTRAAVLRDATAPTGIAQLAAMHSVAPSLGVVVSPLNVRDPEDIERSIPEFARAANGGLILTAGSLGIRHRDLIVTLAARYRLPAVYPYRFFATGGGLMSYGTDSNDTYRRAAAYIDRIGREASRPPGSGADKVRTGDQSEDRQGAQPRNPAHAACPRRRSDRMRPRTQP
jgi:putative ABC transport system substrate-binding protein